MKARRGVSEIIAMLVLIAIAVVAGVIVYSIFINTSTSATSNSSIYITAISGNYAPSVGTDRYSISIKNTGSTAITAIAVSIDGTVVGSASWNPAMSGSAPLAVGESASTNFASGSAFPGTQHLVLLTATILGGGSFTVSQELTLT